MKKLAFLLTLPGLLSMGSLKASPILLYEVRDSPFTTFIARKPGDLVTIVVQETATAADNGNKKNIRKNDQDFNLRQMFFPSFDIAEGFTVTEGGGDEPGFSWQSQSNYEGTAENASNHSLKTTIEGRLVEEVTPGHFVVRARKLVNINGKDKNVYISGVIRQRDISLTNTISSDKIADAVIEIEGDVAQYEVEPGLFGKIFNIIF